MISVPSVLRVCTLRGQGFNTEDSETTEKTENESCEFLLEQCLVW